MATTRYPNRHLAAGGRRLSLVELVLAVSVIVGLGFVTLRVKTMAGWTQPAEATTVGAKSEVPPVAADGTSPKTP
jgi:hypothetical protein